MSDKGGALSTQSHFIRIQPPDKYGEEIRPQEEKKNKDRISFHFKFRSEIKVNISRIKSNFQEKS